MPTPPSPQSSPPDANPPTPPSDPPMDVDSEEKQDLRFDFAMTNFLSIEEPRVYSPWRLFGGFKWRLLVFPHGNQIDSDMSLYLECGGPADLASMASGGQGPGVNKTSPKLRAGAQQRAVLSRARLWTHPGSRLARPRRSRILRPPHLLQGTKR
jgi:hypothetical protein